MTMGGLADLPAFALTLRRVRRSFSGGEKVRRYMCRLIGTASLIATVMLLEAGLQLAGAGLQARLMAQAEGEQHGRLFPPQDLGLLEGPDRDAWQKPDQIMDVLGIADGASVADIGAGAGWFTIRLARRVGPNGLVIAQDVQLQPLEAIRRRVAREGLRNVQTRLGSDSNPNLPVRSLDAVLVVDTYPEVTDRVTFLRNVATALKPGGRIGIVNYKPGSGGPGPSPTEGVRVESTSVERDAQAAGLHVITRQTLPYQYLLVLGS